MRFILQVKPEFQNRLQEIARKYVQIGVSNITIVQSLNVIVGESNQLSFEELSDNEWMANIEPEKEAKGY